MPERFGLRLLASLGIGLTVVLPTLAFAPPAAPEGPPLTVPETLLDAALRCPAPLSGRDHDPVLLVHGTGATGQENWGWNYARVLPWLGFDTCAIDLPNRAWSDIQVSSEYVVYAVRRMVAASGRSVDILGHSQGGLEPRWALRWWPLTGMVDDLVTLGTPHHGVLHPGLRDLSCPVPCAPPAAWQMRAASRFLVALNSVDETPGDVSYTSIWTWTDEFVQTLAIGRRTSSLEGASTVAVQSLCPGRLVDHIGLASDAAVFALVMDAFTHGGPSDPSRVDTRVCLQGQFPGVSPFEARADPVEVLTAGLGAERVAQEPALLPYADKALQTVEVVHKERS